MTRVAGMLEARLLPSVAALLAGLALVVAVRELPRSLRTDHARVESTRGLSALERELAPARFWRMNVPLLLRADRVLPRDAVYAVVVGPRENARGVPLFYAYWLLPRRRTTDVRHADWIVLWGKSKAALPVDAEPVASVGDAGVLRVRR